jgi:hypothetical protein
MIDGSVIMLLRRPLGRFFAVFYNRSARSRRIPFTAVIRCSVVLLGLIFHEYTQFGR